MTARISQSADIEGLVCNTGGEIITNGIASSEFAHLYGTFSSSALGKANHRGRRPSYISPESGERRTTCPPLLHHRLYCHNSEESEP